VSSLPPDLDSRGIDQVNVQEEIENLRKLAAVGEQIRTTRQPKLRDSISQAAGS